MADKKDLFFEVVTPLGFRVRVTHAYWDLIVTIKHPVMAGRQEDLKKTLEQPDEIRQSRSDQNVYLLTLRSQLSRIEFAQGGIGRLNSP
jgi:hypothetical protein